MAEPDFSKSDPQAGWGVPPGQAPYYPVAPRRPTNTMALVSLIIGIVSIMSCQLLGAVAIWLGNKARAEIRQTGEDGDGMALAGIIVGWCGIALTALGLLLVVGYLVVVGVFLAGSGASGY